jgi:hypothetical protein
VLSAARHSSPRLGLASDRNNAGATVWGVKRTSPADTQHHPRMSLDQRSKRRLIVLGDERLHQPAIGPSAGALGSGHPADVLQQARAMGGCHDASGPRDCSDLLD